MRGYPRLWNDWLALLILIGIPALWVWGGLNEIVTGATISAFTLVVQFYFRRAPDGTPGA